MILANPFEDTKKSVLNSSAKIIDIVSNRKIYQFERVVSIVENELQVTYDKVILAINFLFMVGALEYDMLADMLSLKNEAQ
ncbi:MAG: hypothetical protein NTW78_12465 [Campylobacterales bacterium]|nr:hypothetical protein [Campylobacterales bacterium]